MSKNKGNRGLIAVASVLGVLAVALVILIIVMIAVPGLFNGRGREEASSGESSRQESELSPGSQTSEETSSEASSETSSESQESSDEASQEGSSGTEEGSSEEGGSDTDESSEESPQQGTDEAYEAAREALVEELLSQMTLEEKVGQMIMARFPGPSSGAYYAEEYQLGGYVFFDVDFSGYSEDTVRERIDGCQAVSNIPMLMAVDEEGGTVTRVSDYYRDYRFRAPRYIFEDGGWDAIEADTREKCELLLRLHLNMNLAPVADIAGDPYDFMYDRSFGTDLDATCEFIRMTVEIMNEYGVACSLKHFPGYGNNEDTHTGMAIDYRDAETFYNEDFLPFIAGIEAGAGTIMVSHNVVTCFDPEYPASLSPELHELARSLGFEGVLMTDDLAMGAIQEYCGENSAAVLAVLAGNDMLIADDFTGVIESILSAVDDGTITEERIDESVRRILRLKIDMGLIELPQ